MNLILSRHHLIWSCLTLFIVFSCGSSNTADKTELGALRSRIQDKNIQLQDAVKQLKNQQRENNLLKERIELAEKKTPPKTKIVYRDSNGEQTVQLKSELKRLKSDVENWKDLLDKKEKEIKKQQNEVDQLIKSLNQNNVEVVRDELGEIENLKISESPKTQERIDSLLGVLNKERKFNTKAITSLKKLNSIYKKEAQKWQGKFNESGTYLKEHKSNFIVSIDFDKKNPSSIASSVKIKREIGKPKSGKLNVKIICKLANGNQYNLFESIVEYSKKQEDINLTGVRNFPRTTKGKYVVITYLDNKESYYEEIIFEN